MEVRDKFPVILTKDTRFLADIKKYKAEEGGVIILPKDAVLVEPKYIPPQQLNHSS